MKRRTEVIDIANQCTHCPHSIIAIGKAGTLWCPCEDCHPGGLIQGREPKLVSLVSGEGNVSPTLTVVSTPSNPVNNEGDAWVDPMHSL
jgi:hypothetical protein